MHVPFHCGRDYGGAQEACVYPTDDLQTGPRLANATRVAFTPRMIALTMLALALTPAAGPPTPGPPRVSELVVPGGPPPKVAASFPAAGASAPGGVLIIKLVFDQPMTAEGWSYGHAEGGDFPSCLAQPRLLADKRTFVLLCTVGEDKPYAIAVNAQPAFAGANGRHAAPALLRFSTTATVVYDMHDALEQAGLTDADEPIMRWNDDGAGVSRSAPPPTEPGP